MTKIRLSASRVGTYLNCSLLFYYENVLLLPQFVNRKTIFGSLVHSILECLRNPRHKYIYDQILIDKTIDYKKSPVLIRLVDYWQRKYEIPFDILDDLNSVLQVGLIHFDFWQKDAVKMFLPEYEFIFKIGSGDNESELKGIIDALAEYNINGEVIYNIIDYKTKGKLFSAKELNGENIQSSVYQLFIYKKFGAKARVQFVMLRFPPNKLKPKRFIQEVPAKTEDQLRGVELYLEEMGRLFNQFTYQDALAKPCKDFGFCRYVCAHKNPYMYFSVVDKDGKLVKNYLETDFDKIVLKPGEKVIVLEHRGCAKFN